MSPQRLLALTVCAPTFAVLATGCGGGSSSAPTTAAPPATTTTTAATTPAAVTTTAPGVLQAEAAAAATGDVPDNQSFIVSTGKRFTIKYPEGWAQTAQGGTVTIRDKNNIVRIAIAPRPPPTVASAKADLAAEKVTMRTPPQATTVSGKSAVKAAYSTTSAASPVTGKRVALVVDRYELSHGGLHAVVDLGTPEGVDNVDAYRLMIDSFRWR